MLVVICYDVSDNKKRQRLHKLLKGVGVAVQYSIFECLIDKTQLNKLKNRVKPLIQEGEDSITFYCLCESCQKKIQSSEQGILSRNKLTLVV